MTVEQVRPSETDFGLLPVGVALRSKREQLGWSLADVAAWLRIKLYYLEALEGGQVAKLPGNAYALGFLRAYSGALGLDAEDMSRRFRQETKEVSRKPELSFPAPVPERGVPAGAVVLLGVVVVVAAYAGWFEFSGHERRIGHAVPPVPAALSPYAGPVGAPVPSPQVATVMPGPGQTPPALPGPAGGPGDASSAARAGGPAVGGTGSPPGLGAAGTSSASPPAMAAAPVAPSATASGSAAAGIPVPVVSGTAAAPTPAATPGQVMVEAVATSWVQVREVGGKVLYDHVLKPGESWAVPQDPLPLTLATGNAGGVRLAVDGVTSAALGRVGGVRHGVPLSAQAIKDGTVAAASSASATAADQDAPVPVTVHRAGPGRAAVPAQDDTTEKLNERQLDGVVPH